MFTSADLQQIESRLNQATILVRGMGRAIQRTWGCPGPQGGQDGEDAILASLLPQDHGTYVDVGAGDPVENNNTWTFYQRGWRGLLIEPLDQHVRRLVEERPYDVIRQRAIGDVPIDDTLRPMRILGQLSSFREDWRIVEEGIGFVPCIRLDRLLAKFPQFREAQLCSIDVEGLEKEVLETIDWNTFRPDVLCIEHMKYPDINEDISGEWEPLVLAQGYRFVGKTSYNKIYQYKEA